MLLVVTYDVNTADPGGAQRLRQVAKLCEQLTVLKSELQRTMDSEKDSIRFYRLGNHYQNKIDTLGRSAKVEAGQPLIL